MSISRHGAVPPLTRRRFVQGLASAGAVAALGLPRHAWAVRSPGAAEKIG